MRKNYNGKLWTQSKEAAERYTDITYIRSVPYEGLSDDPTVIHQGSNSGYQAINLAYHLGAQIVLLLGYDMGICNRHIKNGQTHWFGEHPPNMRVRSPYDLMRKKYARMHPERVGLTVINCSRTTLLDAFPRMELNNAIEAYDYFI